VSGGMPKIIATPFSVWATKGEPGPQKREQVGVNFVLPCRAHSVRRAGMNL
jgi:hypothetical protein